MDSKKEAAPRKAEKLSKEEGEKGEKH